MKEQYSLFQTEMQQYWLKIRHYYAISYDYFDMETHRHPEWELMYVVSGSCQVFFDNEEAVSLKKGEIIFIDAMVPHRLLVQRDKPCRMLNLEVSYGERGDNFSIRRLAASSPNFSRMYADAPEMFYLHDQGGLYEIIYAIQSERDSGSTATRYDDTAAGFLLGALVVELSRQYCCKKQSKASTVYTRKALVFLNAHFDQDVTVASVANAAGVSQSHLQRLFMQETGQSLVSYLNEKRVEKAKLLLRNSTLSVVEIAVSVGFHNRQHFSSIFHKTTGTAPSQYRMLYRSPSLSGEATDSLHEKRDETTL